MSDRASIRIEDDSAALYFGSFLSRHNVMYEVEINDLPGESGYTYTLDADELVNNVEQAIEAAEEWGAV